ncbi:sel1 repeat family protein [Candidatus Pseudothioglobus singularis]|nr:sel1 repeat family protein [Candidatus Pseudothioglobus singularis]
MKAEQGIPEFQLILADMYREGAGTVSNMQEAISWYEEASSNGNIEATYKLGVVYFKGDGVSEDIDKVIEYVELAAKGGYKMAIQALPNMRLLQQR